LKEFPYIVKNKNRVPFALNFFSNKIKERTGMKIHIQLIDELVTAAKNIGTNINHKKSLYEYAFIKKKYFYYR